MRTTTRRKASQTSICATKTSINHDNIAASSMLAQFMKHLIEMPVDPDIQPYSLIGNISLVVTGKPLGDVW